jgi:glyoxylase-like metal-dependent hydrolase (beta-lactamase superfamily II)
VLVVEEVPDLPITRVSRWCFNCYVVTGDTEGLVVVDPGMPTIADDLAPLLTARLTSVPATLTTSAVRPCWPTGTAPASTSPQRH